MTNDDNARSDLEVGKEAEVNSPSRQKNPSTTTNPMSKYLSWKELKRILRCFDLTKNTTKQKALVLLCVAGAMLDPLFFYIPMINEASKCMKSDRKLAAVAISLRSLVDLLHSLLWWRYYSEKWKTERLESAATCPVAASGVAAAASTTTSSEENKEISQGNSNSMSPRNRKVTGLLIELLSILPLPQATTLAILIIQGSPRSQHAVTLLKFSVLVQFIIRIFRVIPSFREATKNSFTLLKSRFWIGAVFNLLLFMMFSHVLGAFWYLLSVGRMMDCWKSACRKQVGCSVDSLYCGGPMDNKSYLDHNCPIEKATNSSAFDFGIYLEALDSNIVGPTRFPLKLIYCFWWGLRNLSSLGQNLEASAHEWEILFSICITVFGLILVSFFIGNMQAVFQYKTNKDLEKMTSKMDKVDKKRIELFKWEPFRGLPQYVQDKILVCTNDRWLETTEVNLRTMMNYLPEGLDKTFKESILSKLQKKMRLFRALDIRALNVMNYMKPAEFPEESFVFRKGHPIDKMVFILNGKLTKQTGIEGSTPQELRVWDCLGQELLEDISWMTQSSIKGPLSPTDIKTCTKVEALILDTSDLQKLVNQFMDTTKNKKSAASKKAGQSAVHIQKYRLLAMKQRDLLKWQPFRWLPQDLQEEIILCKNARWLKTTEVNLQTMINYLPEGLNKRFKESIFSKLQKKVRLFRALDMRACVKPEVFAEGSLVFKKGLPIDKMVFILDGKLSKQNGSDGSTAQDLQAWDFCGEELLDITRSLPKPTWTADIIACTKVEAFSLDAGDLQTRLNQLNMSVERENFMFEIWTSIIEYKTAMEDAIKKQKKAEQEDAIKKQKKAEEKPNGITKSASFKESSRDNTVGITKSASFKESSTLGGAP